MPKDKPDPKLPRGRRKWWGSREFTDLSKSGFATSMDAIFREYGDELPVSFLRTLAMYESTLRPDPRSKRRKAYDAMTSKELAIAKKIDKKARRTKYWGLFQIGSGVLKDYNKAHTDNLTKLDLTNSVNATKVAAWQLNRIIRAYHGGPHANLDENWLNEDWVRMLVAGWNMGWSRRSGLQHVANWLKKKGGFVEHRHICTKWKAAGARPYPPGRVTAKCKHHRKVAASFVKERRRAVQEEDLDKGPLAKKRGRVSPWMILLALYLFSKRSRS